MDKDASENNGFRGYFIYPDGESYTELLKVEKSWQNAVNTFSVSAKRSGSKLMAVEIWSRYDDWQKDVANKFEALQRAHLSIQGLGLFEIEEQLEDQMDYYWDMMDENTIDLTEEVNIKLKKEILND